MYISNKQLDEILIDGGYINYGDDIVDWDDDIQASFVTDYLSCCKKSDKPDLYLEVVEFGELDPFGCRTNPNEHTNKMHKATDIYIMHLTREDIMESVHRLLCFYLPLDIADKQLDMINIPTVITIQ